MSPQRPARLSYEKPCEQLQRVGVLDEGEIPPLPDRSPQHDDDISSGFPLFRTWLGSGEPFGLALPPDYENKTQESAGQTFAGPLSRNATSRVLICAGQTDS